VANFTKYVCKDFLVIDFFYLLTDNFFSVTITVKVIVYFSVTSKVTVN